MRWLVPWFLLMALISNIFLLAESTFYAATMIAQVSFYTIAISPRLIPQISQLAPVRIISFFVDANLATAHAALMLLTGKRIAAWQPSRR